MFESLETVYFGDFKDELKIISLQEHVIINNIITIIKITVTTGDTSATPERSSSFARRVKPWLRSSVTQKRFNTLTVLHSHKDMVDELSLVAIANDFIDNFSNRRNNPGYFSGSDLH